jgi:hypothetical protein
MITGGAGPFHTWLEVTMSQTVIVVVEGQGSRPYPPDLNPEAPGCDYGNVLARLMKPLDALAIAQGIPALSQFVFTDPGLLEPLLDELEGDAKARVERILASQKEWHSADLALRSVNSLLGLLTAPPDPADPRLSSLRLGGTLAPVLWDLRALRHVLQEADARFHLEAL